MRFEARSKVAVAFIIMIVAMAAWFAVRPPAQTARASMAAPKPPQVQQSAPVSFGSERYTPRPAPTSKPPTPVVRGPPTDVAPPPPNTPVKELLVALKSQADAGVPEAACRLGAELARCHQTQIMVNLQSRELTRIDSASRRGEDTSRARQLLDARYQGLDEAKRLCADVPSETVNHGWQYLLQAGQAGNAAAAAQFAVNPPLSTERVVEDLDGWNAYRQFAPGLLQRAIEGGDVRALYTAFFSSATGMAAGGTLLQKDPYRALVYAHALLPIVDRNSLETITFMLPSLQTEVGLDQLRRADEEGARLRESFFLKSMMTDVSNAVGTARPMACYD